MPSSDTYFVKGNIPWSKGKGKPLEKDIECRVCHKMFHYIRAKHIRSNGYACWNPFPTVCSKECRYKACSTAMKGKILTGTINYSRKDKRKAERVIQRLVRQGVIKKQPCDICGNANVEAHHFKGYLRENWLDIKWLCSFHHHEEHKRLRKSGEWRMI